MKIYLIDQQHHFAMHLDDLKNCSVIPYERKDLKHKIATAVISGHHNLSTLETGILFDYKIFPLNILKACPQWIHENRSLQINDTIVQQIHIPPFLNLSQKIIAGVRISEIIRTDNRIGFSYETLQGHVEKGISTFSIEQQQNSIIFKIETYSTPNGKLLSLFQPLSSSYQDYCTKKALANTARHLSNY